MACERGLSLFPRPTLPRLRRQEKTPPPHSLTASAQEAQVFLWPSVPSTRFHFPKLRPILDPADFLSQPWLFRL